MGTRQLLEHYIHPNMVVCQLSTSKSDVTESQLLLG